jgi:hypothetical protein
MTQRRWLDDYLETAETTKATRVEKLENRLDIDMKPFTEKYSSTAIKRSSEFFNLQKKIII